MKDIHIIVKDTMYEFIETFPDLSTLMPAQMELKERERASTQHIECVIKMYREEKDPNELLEFSDGSQYKMSEVIHELEKELIIRKLSE